MVNYSTSVLATDVALECVATISVLCPCNTRSLESPIDLNFLQVEVTTYDNLSIARCREKRLPVLIVKATTIFHDSR